jgi:putative DNA primase/helicase
MKAAILKALAEADQVAPEEGAAAAFPAENDRPCFRVYDDWIVAGGRKYRPGVYWHGMTAPKGDSSPAQVNTRICGPLYVEARTVDPTRGDGRDFGSLLRFRNRSGKWVRWAMPARIAEGDCIELRRELADMGLAMQPRQRALFVDYLHDRDPDREIRCATSTGWCGHDAFVLTDTVIGPAADSVIFQAEAREHDGHGRAGSLDAWRDRVGGRAIGNPLLVLGLSAAFVAPLLELTKQEPAGLHLVGESSTGKTTLLEAARSAWGDRNFKRSWRATANGLEAVATLHNDCLLPLDELSECDSREAGAIAYLIGNGTGKTRASRTGAARPIKRWRTFVISTGEQTLAAAMAEAGHRTKAGQGVRLLDVPADRRFGVFDELHGYDGGRALADAVKQAAGDNYGWAGRTFLERLTHDGRDFGAVLERLRNLPAFKVNDGSGQVSRAGGRFALVAMAGELATEYGILPWPQGLATAAAVEAYEAWRAWRGDGQDEPRKTLEAVADFLDRHGDSRFEPLRRFTEADAGPPVRDRAGWHDRMDGGRVYHMTAAAMREAVTGFDLKRALDVLESCGAIPRAGGNGRRSQSVTTPDGNKRRVYRISYDALTAALDVGA